VLIPVEFVAVLLATNSLAQRSRNQKNLATKTRRNPLRFFASSCLCGEQDACVSVDSLGLCGEFHCAASSSPRPTSDGSARVQPTRILLQFGLDQTSRPMERINSSALLF